jgi:hypothetical protein
MTNCCEHGSKTEVFKKASNFWLAKRLSVSKDSVAYFPLVTVITIYTVSNTCLLPLLLLIQLLFVLHGYPIVKRHQFCVPETWRLNFTSPWRNKGRIEVRPTRSLPPYCMETNGHNPGPVAKVGPEAGGNPRVRFARKVKSSKSQQDLKPDWATSKVIYLCQRVTTQLCGKKVGSGRKGHLVLQWLCVEHWLEGLSHTGMHNSHPLPSQSCHISGCTASGKRRSLIKENIY